MKRKKSPAKSHNNPTKSHSRAVHQCSAVKNIIQAKMTVSDSHDPFEKQADHVADHILNTNNQQLASGNYRAPTIDRVNHVNAVQQKSTTITPEVTPAMENRLHSLNHGGQALSMADQHFFEPRFNTDLSHVRIHNDQQAHNAARSLNAKAFTYGHHIAFDAGEFNTHSTAGKRLLAHELTHVIQQNGHHRIQREDRSILELTEFYPLMAQINTQGTGFHHLPKVAENITTDYIRPDFNLGDAVKVLGKTSMNWLKVERQLGAEKQTGYVDWRYVDIKDKSQSVKDDALMSPWNVKSVIKLLQMSDSGKATLQSLADDVTLMLCNDIQATQFSLLIIDPKAEGLNARETINGVLAKEIKLIKLDQTPTKKPRFRGHSNKKTTTVNIRKDLTNIEAASTLVHEVMHINLDIFEDGGLEEKFIRSQVSIWRQGMEKVLGFTEDEKEQIKLPDANLPQDAIDKTVDQSKHYTPTKEKIGPDTFIVTKFSPRPVKPLEMKDFKKP